MEYWVSKIVPRPRRRPRSPIGSGHIARDILGCLMSKYDMPARAKSDADFRRYSQIASFYSNLRILKICVHLCPETEILIL